MSILIGAAIAGISAWEVSHGDFGWATYTGLIAIYWLVFAALERFLDKIMDRLVVDVMGPIPYPKDDKDEN